MKPKGIIVLDAHAQKYIYSNPADRAELESLVQIVGPTITRKQLGEHKASFADVEILLTGWGCPPIDESLLAMAPNLKAVFYAAGSIKNVMTEAAWKRGIIITSAYSANAVPVAEFCLAATIFGLKHVWYHAFSAKQSGRAASSRSTVGAYGSTIGLISMGAVARKFRELLRAINVNVVAYDPFMSADQMKALDVEKVELNEVFSRSDVVSLHTPNLPETRGMITGAHIGSMKLNSTFINTARGGVVRETEMLDVLKRRSDITAMLDVTDPEPPSPGSLIWTLPNIMFTPHIAGSVGQECRRMVRSTLDDLARYIKGEKLQMQITRDAAARLA